MVCSNSMIEGPDGEGKARTGPGLGLTHWVIDSHFRERKREARLRHALDTTGQQFGLGLSEGEWVIIQGDEILERHGTPLVIQPPRALDLIPR